MGALVESNLAPTRSRRAEPVTEGQGAVPTTKPLEALLLLFQLGEGELFDRHLMGELGRVLVAGVGERRFEQLVRVSVV